METPFFSLPISEVFSRLRTSDEGLSLSDVEKRIAEFGPNRLKEGKTTSLWLLLFAQFLNPLVIILIIAAGLKLFLGSYVDGGTIGVTVLLMVSLAFYQEAKAERSIQALKNLSPLKSLVKRGGAIQEVLSKELVPGDILVLEAGDKISADARLLFVSHFQVSEASLTGESTPITKTVEPLGENLGLADRKNMVYTSSTVLSGKATAVVTATGMKTELGLIAEQMGEIEKEKTPLQKKIEQFSKWMLLLVAAIVVLFIIVGVFKGLNWLDITLFSIAIAVAAIPEGLPAVVTVVLSNGVRLMTQKNALIRKLLAVETLGSTSVICTDKTGTLTLNQLTVSEAYSHAEESKLIDVAALCGDAQMREDGWKGDPVDVALFKWCEERGIELKTFHYDHHRITDIPFSSENGVMATLNAFPDRPHLLVKGAPEKVLERCRLEDTVKAKLHARLAEMSKRGLKVLAAARKAFSGDHLEPQDIQHDLEFCGFFGLIDPPRDDARQAIEKCQQASIHVSMVTGDHALTAQAIGEQIGLLEKNIITGQELNNMSDEELNKKVMETTIFARVEPLQKLKLVRAYKSLNQIVAMTGDGVNDSPALAAADIGVAMGQQGTDVAKEASEMILLDDRFATIVDAVEEGRVLFARLRHAATFLLATCFGEVLVILLAFFTVGVAPLEPLQILWINLITGTLLAVPLGTEPKVGDELTYPPLDPAVGLIYPGLIFRVAAFAFCLGLGAFGVFLVENPSETLFRARSAVFTTVILFEWLMVFQIRSDEKPLLKLGFFTNKKLLIALGIAIILLMLILYVPSLNVTFHTRGLTLYDWGLCILPGLGLFVLEEIRKFIFPKLFIKGKWKKKFH
ncbi:MAG: HAD-IC family P-type ATPase [Simkaniaceae bacterium]|nr:HAD-IC family P-type ATPase [Candidatus Sacchlamyda saccharinae]